jgi:hypothetical protein
MSGASVDASSGASVDDVIQMLKNQCPCPDEVERFIRECGEPFLTTLKENFQKYADIPREQLWKLREFLTKHWLIFLPSISETPMHNWTMPKLSPLCKSYCKIVLDAFRRLLICSLPPFAPRECLVESPAIPSFRGTIKYAALCNKDDLMPVPAEYIDYNGCASYTTRMPSCDEWTSLLEWLLLNPTETKEFHDC